MSIRGKIFLSYLLILVIYVAFAITRDYMISFSRRDSAQILPITSQSLAIQEQLNYLNTFESEVNSYVLIGSEDIKHAILTGPNKSLATLSDILGTEGEHKEHLLELGKLMGDLNLNVKEMVEGNERGTDKAQFNDDILKIFETIDKLKVLEGEMVKDMSEELSRILDSQVETITNINRLSVSSGVLILVVGLALSFFVSGSISRPLIRLRDAAVSIGKGNLDEKIENSGDDEVGQLAKSINQMVLDLKESRGGLERLVAERTNKLEENEEFLKETQAVAKLGSYNLDIVGNRWTSTKILDEIFGIDESFERTIESWSGVLFADDKEEVLKYFKDEVLGSTHRFDREYRIVRKKDGVVRWVHGLGKVVLDEGGKPLRMIGTIQDVTDFKLAQLAVTREHELIKQYIDVAGVILVVLDTEGRVNLINKKGALALGLPEEKIVGQNWFDRFIPDEIRKDLKEAFKVLVSGTTERLESYENVIINAKGEKRLIAWHNNLLKDGSGQIVGTISSGEDITEKKEQEELLQRQNDLMVGRELKMVELKRELDELKNNPAERG